MESDERLPGTGASQRHGCLTNSERDWKHLDAYDRNDTDFHQEDPERVAHTHGIFLISFVENVPLASISGRCHRSVLKGSCHAYPYYSHEILRSCYGIKRSKKISLQNMRLLLCLAGFNVAVRHRS